MQLASNRILCKYSQAWITKSPTEGQRRDNVLRGQTIYSRISNRFGDRQRKILVPVRSFCKGTLFTDGRSFDILISTATFGSSSRRAGPCDFPLRRKLQNGDFSVSDIARSSNEFLCMLKSSFPRWYSKRARRWLSNSLERIRLQVVQSFSHFRVITRSTHGSRSS